MIMVAFIIITKITALTLRDIYFMLYAILNVFYSLSY